jgi:predicted ribosomally synthesized peptide with SipW-like signal peptide
MTKQQKTRKALIASALSVTLSAALFAGSTLAWFTDSTSSGISQITAGNLDIELEYATFTKNTDGTETVTWKTVDDASGLFDDIALWEPGTTGVVYFRLSNLGSLALTYQLGLTFNDTAVGKTEDGKDIKLSDYLEFGVVDGQETKFDDRDAARKAVTNPQKVKNGFSNTQSLGVTTKKSYFALVVYMPESVGNEANYRGSDIPKIELGINLVAKQDTIEKDSFNETYD